MSITIDKIIASETPINPNKYTATPPLITMSKIKIEGIIDDKKYMLEISDRASNMFISKTNKNSK